MARAASVRKAYTVAIIFLVVGGVWTMMTGGLSAGIRPLPMGLAVAGGLGIVAAAFTSIRVKRRAEKNA